MPLSFISPQEHFQNSFHMNLFGGDKFAYRMSNRGIDWDRFAEGEEIGKEGKRLPRHYVHGQDRIGNTIRELEKKQAKETKRPAIRSALRGRPEESSTSAQLNTCHEAMKALNSPVETPKQFRDAMSQINGVNHMLFKIRTADFDWVDVNHMMNAKVIDARFPPGALFSDRLKEKAKEAERNMIVADKILNEKIWTLDDTVLMKQAQSEWPEEEKNLKNELSKLEKGDNEAEEGSPKRKGIKNMEKEVEKMEKNKPRSHVESVQIAYRKRLNELKAQLINLKAQKGTIEHTLKNKVRWINHRSAELQAEKEIYEENVRTQKDIDSDAIRREFRGKGMFPGGEDHVLEQIGRGYDRDDDQKREWKYKERIHTKTREIESRRFAAVSDKMAFKDKEEITNVLLEIREMRLKQVREHLKNKFKNLQYKFRVACTEGKFADATIRGMEDKFKEFGEWVHLIDYPAGMEKRFEKLFQDIREKNPKAVIDKTPEEASFEEFTNLSKAMDVADMQLNMSKGEIKRIQENRPTIEKEVTTEFEVLKRALAPFNSEENETASNALTELKKQLYINEKKRLDALSDEQKRSSRYDSSFGQSVIYKKAVSAIEDVMPGGYIHQKIQELQEKIDKIDEMPPEELQAFKNEFAILKPQIKLLKNLNENIEEALKPDNIDARNARTSIIELKKAKDINGVISLLEKNLGDKHVLVDQGEFDRLKESNESNVTGEEGTKEFMVFRKITDELGNTLNWQIVINPEALDDPDNLEELKKQATHELLHVEFEKSEKIQDEAKKMLFGRDKESRDRWTQIKKAFLALDKPPPEDGKPWTDEDILNELYAMQNEIGHTWRPEKDEKGKTDKTAVLNNLLVNIGLKEIFDKMNKLLGREEADMHEDLKALREGRELKEVRRGYQAGVSGDDEDTVAVETPESADTSIVESRSGVDRVEGGGNPSDYEMIIENNEEWIKRLLKSEYVNNVPGAAASLKTLNKLNEGAREMNDYLKKDKTRLILSNTIDKRLGTIKENIRKVEIALTEASGKSGNTEINPFRALWNKTNFMAPCDIVQMLINVKEYLERRHERKKNDHAARLGMALFQGTALGQESYARLQKAEMEEVNEWQSRYENLSAWEMQDEIDKMASSPFAAKDQLKALLRLLAQKGRIDWRNENLWRVLNKLQSAVNLVPGDEVILHSPSLLRQKLHTALGEIYDYDEFLSLERQNESGYEGEMRKYLPSYDRMQDQLTERLDQLLAMYRNGQPVDPMEYEAIITYAIENGKSYEENVLFHIMAGIARGLLTPDRGLAIDKNLNKWPATQWIYSKKPPLSKRDYEFYCKKFFPDDYESGSIDKPGTGTQFKNFFWTEVQNDLMTIQRVRKSVLERGWDHDWSRSIACLGDANTAKQYYSGKAGQQETHDTGVANSYVGALQWIEENAKRPGGIEFVRNQFARQAAWLAMSEGILGRVAYYTNVTNDAYTRSNASMERDVPRLASTGNHGDWTFGQHRAKAQKFLNSMDCSIDKGGAGFFNVIKDERRAATQKGKEELGAIARDYLLKWYPNQSDEWNKITNIDSVYDKMDFILQTMTSSEYLRDNVLMSKVKSLTPDNDS